MVSAMLHLTMDTLALEARWYGVKNRVRPGSSIGCSCNSLNTEERVLTCLPRLGTASF